MGRRLTGDWTGRQKFPIKRHPPTVSREDYLDYMTFQRPLAPLFTEIFGPLIGLPEEWMAQGATPEEIDFSAFRYREPPLGGIGVNPGHMRPDGDTGVEVLEETDDAIIVLDGMERRMKLPKGYATIPLPLDYPVKTMDDWLRFKPRFEFSEARFGDNWEARARSLVERGVVVGIGMPGAFSTARDLMGDEAVCVAFYDQPELIHDMLDTFGDTMEKILHRVMKAVRVDQLNVHEDMAGKSGPLAGPKQIAEFIGPYYRRVWDMARAAGCRLFNQDSDGDMSPVVGIFADYGLNQMHPVEPVGGNDVVALMHKYRPRMAFQGGVDKHVLRKGEAAIAAELERIIPPMVRSGGYYIALDHRVPNGTPLAAYRFYVRKVWEILARECAKAHLPLDVPAEVGL
jgi:uroporphyrinogen-III decarboxylase